jgi:hypothetical protein
VQPSRKTLRNKLLSPESEYVTALEPQKLCRRLGCLSFLVQIASTSNRINSHRSLAESSALTPPEIPGGRVGLFLALAPRQNMRDAADMVRTPEAITRTLEAEG